MYGPRFFVGVDLGQANDYTAISIVEARSQRVGEDGRPAGMPQQNLSRRSDDKLGTLIDVRHLERFRNVDYSALAERIVELAEAPALRAEQPYFTYHDGFKLRNTRPLPPGIAVDATGVGRPVCNLLTGYGLEFKAITITGGSEQHYSRGFYYVPKRDLISALQVALQSGWLKIAKGLALAETLRQELLNFRVKVNIATGHDSYEAWRVGDHDDLVLATAMACWAATRPRRGLLLVGGR
jgi:hypothetical protein